MLSTKSSVPSWVKRFSSLERHLHLFGERPVLLLTLPQERHVVGLAHVEVQVDRVDRDERGEQGGRAGGRPAARDQIADRDQVGADAAREGRRDAAVVQIEPGVADVRFILRRRPPGPRAAQQLADQQFSTLPRRVRSAMSGTHELAIREIEPRTGAFELCRGLAQLDLVGRRIDHEKQIALVDDVAVLEADLRERAADLGAQLDVLHGRELAREFEPGRRRHAGAAR